MGSQTSMVMEVGGSHCWHAQSIYGWTLAMLHGSYESCATSTPQAESPPVSKGDVGHTSDQRNVWWGFRDSAWLCRATYAGRTYVKSLSVMLLCRRDCSEYEATKNNAYVAICEWQRRVEAGDDPGTGVTIVQSDPSAVEVSETAVDAEASQFLTPPR